MQLKLDINDVIRRVKMKYHEFCHGTWSRKLHLFVNWSQGDTELGTVSAKFFLKKVGYTDIYRYIYWRLLVATCKIIVLCIQCLLPWGRFRQRIGSCSSFFSSLLWIHAGYYWRIASWKRKNRAWKMLMDCVSESTWIYNWIFVHGKLIT